MPGRRRKPFSHRQKKQQLKLKKKGRQLHKSHWGSDSEDGTARPESTAVVVAGDARAANRHHTHASSAMEMEIAALLASKAVDTAPQRDRGRFKLKFAKESKEELEFRKRASREPLEHMTKAEALEFNIEDEARLLDMPVRPAWSYKMTKEALLAQEEDYFRQYLTKLLEAQHYSQHAGQNDGEEVKREGNDSDVVEEEREDDDEDDDGDDDEMHRKLSYFDLNLETWRQLWRVLEIADVIVVVMDSRYVPLHLPVALYRYVAEQLKKPLIFALNKCDLVGPYTQKAWVEFLSKTFPNVKICKFSSFATHHEGNPASRRKFRKKLKESHGLGQFLDILDALGVDGVAEIRERVLARKSGKNISGSDEDDMSSGDDSGSEGEGENDSEEASNNQQIGEASMIQAATSKKVEHAGDNDVVSDNGSNLPSSLSGAYSESLVPTDTDTIPKRYTTLGVVGQPNAGKSTIINALVGRHVVSTSATPGHTKHFQTYFLSPHVRLCDCPGLVFPSFFPRPLQVLAGIYPISQVREPYSAIQFLAERVDLVTILGLQSYADRHQQWSAWLICEKWAEKRKFFTSRAARPDTYRAANDILRHCVEGRIVLSLKPPDFFANYGDHDDKPLVDPELALANKDSDEDDAYEALASQAQDPSVRTLLTGASEEGQRDRGKQSQRRGKGRKKQERYVVLRAPQAPPSLAPTGARERPDDVGKGLEHKSPADEATGEGAGKEVRPKGTKRGRAERRNNKKNRRKNRAQPRKGQPHHDLAADAKGESIDDHDNHEHEQSRSNGSGDEVDSGGEDESVLDEENGEQAEAGRREDPTSNPFALLAGGDSNSTDDDSNTDEDGD